MRFLWLAVCLVACSFDPSVSSPGASDDADIADGPSADVAIPPGANLVTLHFREGRDFYQGTHDTYLKGWDRDSLTAGSELVVKWDGDNAGEVETALIRFDGIVGGDGVPPGALIADAQLTITVTNDSEPPAGELYEVAIPWSEESISFNTFGATPGVQVTEDLGVRLGAAPLITDCGQCPLPTDIDVRASVQRWSDGDSQNHGWAVVPGSPNATFFASREDFDRNRRPQLTVTYVQ